MERRPRNCLPDSFYELCEAMNKPTDEVAVSKAALEDVARCHVRTGNRPSLGMIIKQGRTRHIVRRQALWDFVQEHGKAC